jgi:Protein of unknown function (DUF2510)
MDSSTPAAWHADPHRRHQYRFWNGAAWSEHVSDNGVVSVDPVEAAHTGGGSNLGAAATWAAPQPAVVANQSPAAPADTPHPSATGFWAALTSGKATEPPSPETLMGIDDSISAAGELVACAKEFKTSGFGASSASNRKHKAAVRVTNHAVWVDVIVEKAFSMTPSHSVVRLAPADILDFAESEFEKTGLNGAAARKNSSTNAGRMMGSTSEEPGVLLRTRQGDLFLTNANRNGRVEVREIFAALVDLLPSK